MLNTIPEPLRESVGPAIATEAVVVKTGAELLLGATTCHCWLPPNEPLPDSNNP